MLPLKHVEAIDLSNYTAETANAVKAALAYANEIFADETADQVNNFYFFFQTNHTPRRATIPAAAGTTGFALSPVLAAVLPAVLFVVLLPVLLEAANCKCSKSSACVCE